MNKNGFIDMISYDLDGDTVFEEKVSLLDLGIDDRASIINTGNTDYKAFNKLFRRLTSEMWDRTLKVLKIAHEMNINTNWYAFWQQPRTLQEKYEYGFWLTFYLYKDMCHIAAMKGDTALKAKLDKAYYSGHWELFSKE
jgi:hypothetical protein